ncbi:hypothetical protein M3Y94_00630900 [Aphelenchoides besseyi]|nr:hypothetical protein M3Y94_00630900 [Aphelenchoides besseyi]
MRRLQVIFISLSVLCAIVFTTLLMNHEISHPNTRPSASGYSTSSSKRIVKRETNDPQGAINLSQLNYSIEDIKLCQEKSTMEMPLLNISGPYSDLLIGTRSSIFCLSIFTAFPNRLTTYAYDIYYTRQHQLELLNTTFWYYGIRPFLFERLCRTFFDPNFTAEQPSLMASGCSCAGNVRKSNGTRLRQAVNVVTEWICCCLPKALHSDVTVQKNINDYNLLSDFYDDKLDHGMEPPPI